MMREIRAGRRPGSALSRFELDGTEITDLPEKDLYPLRKRVAMLFQGGALFDSMTVYENVSFALREHTDWKEDRIRDRVQESPTPPAAPLRPAVLSAE